MCSINDVNIGDEVLINIGRNVIRAEVLAVEEDKVKVRNLANGNEFFTSRLQEVVPPEEPVEKTEETAAAPPKKLSLIEAAYEILKAEQRPMNTKELVKLAAGRGLWTPGKSKTPEQSLYGGIFLEIKNSRHPRFKKSEERGKFQLNG